MGNTGSFAGKTTSLSFTVKTFCTTEVCTMAQHERVKGFIEEDSKYVCICNMKLKPSFSSCVQRGLLRGKKLKITYYKLSDSVKRRKKQMEKWGIML